MQFQSFSGMHGYQWQQPCEDIRPLEDLSLLIDLNESEKESIKHYSQGEALFVCGSRRMRINVAVTQEELDSFGIGGGF